MIGDLNTKVSKHISILLQVTTKSKFWGTAFICITFSFLFLFAHYKTELHIDDIYSYIFSNDYQYGCVSENSALWNHWIGGKDLLRIVSVQSHERFTYAKVYRNCIYDSHPPLFYWGLHTICSFFPSHFSKWYGLSLNIVLSLISLIIFYCLGKELLRNEKWAMVSVILYCSSRIFFNTVLFIRMYELLTLFTLLLLLLFIKILYKQKLTCEYAVLLFLTTFCGLFTQYLFCVFAFYATLFFCIYQLREKNYLFLLEVGGVMTGAVIFFLIANPLFLTQALNSSHVSSKFFIKNPSAGSMIMYSVYSISRQTVMALFPGKFLSGFLIGSFAGTCFLHILNSKSKNIHVKYRDFMPVCWGLFILICSIVTIGYICRVYPYSRYLFHISPVFILWTVLFLKQCAECFFLKRIIFIHLLLAACCNYLVCIKILLSNFKTTGNNCEMYNLIPKVPTIVISPMADYALTANLQSLFRSPRLYITQNEKIDLSQILTKGDAISSPSEIMVMIVVDKDWGNGFDSQSVIADLLASGRFSKCQFLCNHNFCDVFRISQ